ncbi:APC family permease, partial [uncultured Clostridium sp.]
MKAGLGKLDIFTVALGSIIGWGAFMLPGNKFLLEAGVVNTALGLILGAIAIIIIEKSYERMLGNHNDNGGEFSYIYNEMGEKHGFILGWFLSLAYLSIIPLNATAFPLVVNKLLNNSLKFGYLYDIAGYEVYFGEILVSSIIIIFFALTNIRGLHKTVKIQKVITIFLIAFIFIITILMFIKVDFTHLNEVYIKDSKIEISQVFKIFAIAPWAFIGFDAIPQLTQDMNFSPKKSSRFAILSIIFALVIYNLLNVITGMVYSPSSLSTIDWPTGMAVLNNIGKGSFILLVVSLTFAVWGGLNGFMISTNKLMGAMAEYKVLPKILCKKNKYNENQNIIIFISIISLIAPWFGRKALNWIVDMSSIGATIAYAYVCYVMIKKSLNLKEKIFGLIGFLLSCFFASLLLIPQSPASLDKEAVIALILWIIIGIS